jgi:uncharacterized protein
MIGLIAFLFLINMLGRLRRSAGIAAGAVLFPMAAVLFFNAGLIGFLLLIPVGLGAGFILSLLGPALTFGSRRPYNRGEWRGGGWTGGFGGGGFSSGGFGGGGGGFGGGGASGGW